MTVATKMVTDPGVNGDEFMQDIDIPEFCHRPFSSMSWLM